MKRRAFLKSMAAGGLAASVAGTAGMMLPKEAAGAKKIDIGEIKGVKIDVLTETSWFDNDQFKKDIMDYGGAMTNQYTIPWKWDNAGGYATLITVTTLDGQERKFMMDFGWNTEWMDYIYEEKSDVASLISKDEIEFWVLSHWHLDHFWGVESTLKRKQDITLYAPATYYPEDMALLKEKAHHKAKDKETGEMMHICKNDYPHTGKLVLCDEKGEKGEGIYRLMPGVAVKYYDVPILLRVRGENVLYFNVKDKGIVTVTGCCHPGVLSLFSYARKNFAGYKPYGCYGGLHISLFETWEPKFDDIIKGVKAFKIQKLGCNHCTGWIWAEKAAAAGIPVVKGTNKYKSYKKTSTVAKASNVFLTNGDTVVF
ncbi:MAG: MBL fold metallo-hydrolase [Deltaproteobacteria bacterium]|nr:MBL fold metallo-hydrolase [Deltaproteobacteria bacterium]MBW2130967.1 MBL fold metallo-hydrolase [Deltaproteobacteria bacterium]